MLIAMDFDGVVVDGVDECMLITWNVLHDRPLSDFNQDALQILYVMTVTLLPHSLNLVMKL